MVGSLPQSCARLLTIWRRRVAEALVSYAPPSRERSRIEPMDLWRRWEAMKSQRALWEFDWQDIVNYLIPGANDILFWRAPGMSRTEYIFDSRVLTYPQTLAANMQGAVTNPALQWFRLKFRLEALNQLQHVNGWLQACDETMLDVYNASNFYQAAHTFYVNLGGFGTAAMFCTARRGTLGVHLQFKTLPTGSYCIAENSDGRVDTLFRECWFSPRQAYQQFGEGVSARTIERMGQAAQMDVPERYLHAVYPREERRSTKVDNRNMPYISVYLDCETKEIVQETGFEEFPYVVSRWETLSNAPWGFGPGHLALPDVRVLNALTELNLEQLILWARPPLKMLREGVIGNVSLEPWALNVVSQADALSTLDVTGRPDLIQIDKADLRQSLRDIFFIDALQGLPPPEASQMTAFEVAQRIEQMQRLMGPAFTRLLSEMLDPLADRVFGLLLRGRALPFPPQEVLDAARQNAGQLDVEYEGPLARAQRGTDLRAIGDVVNMGGQIVGLRQDADVLDNIDWDKAYRHAAGVAGIPRALLRDARDVVILRQVRTQQQQQLQQAEAQRQDAAAMGRVAPAVQALHQASQPAMAA